MSTINISLNTVFASLPDNPDMALSLIINKQDPVPLVSRFSTSNRVIYTKHQILLGPPPSILVFSLSFEKFIHMEKMGKRVRRNKRSNGPGDTFDPSVLTFSLSLQEPLTISPLHQVCEPFSPYFQRGQV